MSQAKRILIVDDDEDTLQLLKERIEELDLFSLVPTIDLAQDGLKALPLLREQSYDLILIDYLMPKLGGLQLIETIRNEEGKNRLTPILCLSGYLPKMDTSAPSSILDKVIFLEKPFSEVKFQEATRLLLKG